MSSLWFTAATSLLCVVAWILWRVWPVLAGSARPNDTRAVRLVKWNRHLLKLLRKTLTDRLPVAQVGFFKSTLDGQEHSLATWSLGTTLIPDVEYLALARPGTQPAPSIAVDAAGEDQANASGDNSSAGAPTIAAIVGARELRGLLGDAVQPHPMWGHPAWIYDWPHTVDLDAVVATLTPVEEFRARHGLVLDADEPPEAPSVAPSAAPKAARKPSPNTP